MKLASLQTEGFTKQAFTVPKRLEVSLVDGLALKVVAMEMGYRMSESVAALDRV